MKRPGQSLLELMIAIGVVTTSTIAAVTLIVRTITVGQESRFKTEAMNYAREGVEIVRMVRDSNWLRIDQNILDGGELTKWDDTGRANGYEPLGASGVEYYYLNFNTTLGWRLQACPGGNLQCVTGRYRNINIFSSASSAFASQQPGACAGGCTITPYRRIVKVTRCSESVILAGTNVALPCLDVTSTVEWVSGGLTKQSLAGARLYNWR